MKIVWHADLICVRLKHSMSSILPEKSSVSSLKDQLSLDDSEHSFTVLADFLERFVNQWDQLEKPPEINQFLPEKGRLRKLVLTELIKVDLELRWQEYNFPKRLNEYQAEFSELTDGTMPGDLIYEEYHIRKNCGFQVDPKEYIEQFPEQAAELECLLGMDSPYQRTGLFGKNGKQKLNDIHPGQELDDFELLTMLGEGAFAKVFLARQKSMQRLVALKLSVDEGSEPQTLAQFDHDYIVRVFDQRILEEENIRLLYMQYLSGGTLHEVIRKVKAVEYKDRTGQLIIDAIAESLEKRGETLSSDSTIIKHLKQLSWADAVCWLGSRLAKAFDYSHGRGVLHRDVKPANVLLSSEGIPKLADFNISFCSKLKGATPCSYFGGSLAYMSPEQLEACNPSHEREAGSLDHRSDLYSLGVLLWELLIGNRPFPDEQLQDGWTDTLGEMTNLRTNGIQEKALSELPESCSKELINILLTCLNPQLDKRWQSGKELALQLELCQNPEAQALLYPERSGARKWMKNNGILVIILAAAIPNILAGMFNYFYNDAAIIKQLGDEAKEKFFVIQSVINLIAYPSGLLFLAFLSHKVVHAVNNSDQLPEPDQNELDRLRNRSLNLGVFAAMISVTLWVIAGIAYPVSLQMALPSGHFGVLNYPHFLGSLFLCGLIAASYPFFLVTIYSLSELYPSLITQNLSKTDDKKNLFQLNRRSGVFFLMAIAVPMIGISAILMLKYVSSSGAIAAEETTNQLIDLSSLKQVREDTSSSDLALFILSLGGTLGAIFIFRIFRKMQGCLNTYQDVMNLIRNS